MAFDLETLTRIDIDTLPTIYVNQLESAQSLNFYILIFFQSLFYQQKELLDKYLGILFRYTLLGSQ